MNLLKAHARFLIVMIVLIAVLWIASGQFTGLAESLEGSQTKARANLQANYKALFADAKKFNGSPATEQGRKIQDETQVVNTLTGLVNDQMVFETDAAYTIDALPPGSGLDDQVDFYRNRMRLELERELGFQRYIAIQNIRDPQAFGFKAADNPTEADVIDYLRKLDIVRCVAHSAGNSNVQRVNGFNFVEINDLLNARKVPTSKTQPDEEPYFRGQGLEVNVEATEDALYNFLLDLQRPEKEGLRRRYLSVEKFEFEKPDLMDPKDALITAEITVVAWRVNPDSSYPPDETKTNNLQSSGSGPRKFR